MKVGFIGIGNMGMGMAMNLLKENGQLMAWDMSEEKKAEIKAAGAEIPAGGQAELAKECDVVGLSLPAPQHVRAVVTGTDGLLSYMKAGSFILDMSTIDPKTSQEMAEEAAKHGVTYIDNPVSGGKPASVGGTLSMMAGCTEEEIAPIRNLVDAMGKVQCLGKRGFGSALKLINNTLTFSHLVADAEAIIMAERLGVSDETFFDVILASSGADFALNFKKAKVMNEDWGAAFTIELALKDMDLAAQLCKDVKSPNYSLNNAIQMYRMAQAYGLGKMDTISIVKMLREIMPLQ